MEIPLLYNIRYDRGVKEGTAEYYDDWYEPELYHGVMFFHDEDDFHRWENGASFRLINHWTKSAPVPQYDKAERKQKRR